MSEEDYNRLVPLRTYLDAPEAQMLKTFLEANGVLVFLNAEHVAAMNEGLKTDILVRSIDKVRAESALKGIESLSCHQRHKLRDEGKVDDDDIPSCEQCGAMHIHSYVGPVPTFFPGIRIAAEEGGGWMHCLQCDSYYRTGRRRFRAFPIAMMWGGALGALCLTIYWLITFIKLL